MHLKSTAKKSDSLIFKWYFQNLKNDQKFLNLHLELGNLRWRSGVNSADRKCNFLAMWYVCGNRCWTTHCMNMPFVSTDRYDLKEVFWYLGHVLKPSEKFFHPTQTQPLQNFWSISCLIWTKIDFWASLTTQKQQKITHSSRLWRKNSNQTSCDNTTKFYG